jgi:putative ABC transport system ATP-binding protein
VKSSDAVLRCERLVRFYDTPGGRVQAVRGVDLEIRVGISTAIAGPSGSGKSTLLRMLAGLDRPTAGHIELDGVDIWQLSERARAKTRARVLTHVFQRPDDNLYPHLTAEMQLQRLVRSRGSAATLTREWLAKLGLEHRATHLPAHMSGGEKQRLAFARAAVSGHRLVIADEPTSQLDNASSDQVLNAIDVMNDDGITVVMATHDRRALERVEHVVALHDGAVASVSTDGVEYALLDAGGRIQLPPQLLARFPEGRVRVVWSNDSDRIELERP